MRFRRPEESCYRWQDSFEPQNSAHDHPPHHAALSRAQRPSPSWPHRVPDGPSAAPCASWVCRVSSNCVASSVARQPLRAAPKPLEKRRRSVRFAPIWPISVHYSDRSRHAARRRAQRPRSTALGRHTARRTTRRRSSAAGTAYLPRQPSQARRRRPLAFRVSSDCRSALAAS